MIIDESNAEDALKSFRKNLGNLPLIEVLTSSIAGSAYFILILHAGFDHYD